MSPNKLLTYMIVVLLYAVTSMIVLNSVPALLREADDFSVAMGALTFLAWVVVSVYIGYRRWFKNQSKSEKDSQK